jgi:hypothetical protein
MAENRLTRELENRETAARVQQWRPPETLPMPNPVPGTVFRYIRIATMGQADPTNASAKRREGWEPVKATEVPEIMHFAENNPNSRYKDNVEIGGLVLCKAPTDLMKQRDEYYRKQAQAQTDAVDNSFLRQKDDRTNMTLFTERKSEVSFGRGK